MAIEKLRTNFQDDIINTDITDKRRYNLINNSDGTVSLDDVTTYVQIGSNYGAQDINTANGTINQLIDNADGVAETLNGLDKVDNTPDSEKHVAYAEEAGSAKTAETAGTANKATTSGSADNDIVLINKGVITFNGTQYTVNDSRITADSLADVYFTEDTIDAAEEAVISVETYDGKLILTRIRETNDIIKASIRVRVV